MAKKDDNCCGKTVTETTSTTTKYGMAACEPERGTLQYIGARYVPVFATPTQWSRDRAYEHLMMVQDQGNTYISKQAVPVGIDLPTTTGENDYWILMSNWNAQIEEYREVVEEYKQQVEQFTDDVEEDLENIEASVKQVNPLTKHVKMVIAHRGYSDLAPENSIAAFTEAGLAGAQGCEADLHLTKDGYLVCIHDPTINRTTSGSGYVSGYNLSELREYKLISPTALYQDERIPTYENYLDVCLQFGMTPCIEIKHNNIDAEYIEKLLKPLDARGLRYKCMFHSWQANSLTNLKAHDPNVFVSLVTRTFTNEVVDSAVASGFDGLYLDLASYNYDVAEYAHGLGVFLTQWTGPLPANWPVSRPNIDGVVCNNPFANTDKGTFSNKDAFVHGSVAGANETMQTVYSNNLLAGKWLEKGVLLNNYATEAAEGYTYADYNLPSIFVGKVKCTDVLEVNLPFSVKRFYVCNGDTGKYTRLDNSTRGHETRYISVVPDETVNQALVNKEVNAFLTFNFASTDYVPVPSAAMLEMLSKCVKVNNTLSDFLTTSNLFPIGAGWNLNYNSTAQRISPGFILGAQYKNAYNGTGIAIGNEPTYANTQPAFIVRTYERDESTNTMTLIKDYGWKQKGANIPFTGNEGGNPNAVVVVICVDRERFYGNNALVSEYDFTDLVRFKDVSFSVTTA